MSNVAKMEIPKSEKLKAMYLNFFPVVFMPFSILYLLLNGENPKSLFLTNALISIALLLTPMLVNISMIGTKFLYKEKNKNAEIFSVGLGTLCLPFMIISILYLYFKFFTNEIPFVHLKLAITSAGLLSCLISSIMFAVKYFSFAKQFPLQPNIKMTRFIIAGLVPLFAAIVIRII